VRRYEFRRADLFGALLILLLLAVSGERESELRARLESEREFSEAVAWESDQRASALLDP
jgi:hypothetical protein